MLRNSAWTGTWLGLVFVGVIIGLTVELNLLSLSIDARELTILCLKVSVALSFLAGLIIWDKKSWTPSTRYKTIALAVLGGLMIGTWATLLSNRMGTDLRQSKIIEVEIMSEEAYFQGGVVISPEKAAGPPDRYLSTFRWRGDVYQLSLNVPLFPDKEVGDRAELTITTGLWGYRYVEVEKR
ncbi:MAG: hypothetical protein AAFP08_01530 [Bacteroidota bacterium]